MKKAIDLKAGNKIKVGGEVLLVNHLEVSEIGKHGSRKVRIEAKKISGETIILIRPHDYPINNLD